MLNTLAWLDALLPISVRGAEADRLHGARLLAASALIAVFGFSFFALLQLQAGNPRLSLAQGGAALLTVFLLVGLRRASSIVGLAHVLVVLVFAQITFVSVLFGGAEPPALAFYAVVPLLAMIALG